MYITRVKILNNHGSQIIDWIKAIWAVFKIFWSNFCFHRIMFFCYLRVHPSFLPHSSNSQIALSFNSLAPFFHYSISTDLPYFSSNFFIPLAPHFFTLHFLSRAPHQSKSLTSFAKLSQPSSFSFSHFHSHILTPPPILFSLSSHPSTPSRTTWSQG